MQCHTDSLFAHVGKVPGILTTVLYYRTDILSEQDLYKILGAPRSSSPNDLRRCYIQRSKIIHPDRPPVHEESTAAFQRLSHAYEILKKPSLRAHYDRESSCGGGGGGEGGRQGFKGAVRGIMGEFLSGEFALVGRVMDKLNQEFPAVLNDDTIAAIEKAFNKMREMALTIRIYFLLMSIELSRIRRVSRKLLSLRYFDVIGRMRLTAQLARVTLAAPVRVDRALQRRREREYRVRKPGRSAVSDSGGGLLNDRVRSLLEFIAGSEIEDMEEDDSFEKVWGEQ
ncbi:DnaJ-domain-containing protein [Tuber magnatum]|uniref:DnaJ-domain-containing protein n=1 Tax=Tuber magnatum TaxID=42249 RepID=A0A317SL99_9PEZI|nr:DnaJ-domain-containing protein [Tuber magnatum]